MRSRVAMAVGAITVALTLTGIAWAAQDAGSTVRGLAASDDSDPTSSTELTTTSNTAATSTTGGSLSVPAGSNPTTTATVGGMNGTGTLVLADGEVGSILVADAGSVLLGRTSGSLTILSTQANAGWAGEVEVGTGREVEGDFRNGPRRVKFNFELEDGVVEIRIEPENSAAGASSTSTTRPSATTGTTGTTGTTSTTIAVRQSADLPTGSATYNLDGAGTVIVVFANGGMSIGSISPAAGWTIDASEQRPDEIRVELANGDSEAGLRVRLNNGQVKVEIDSKDS